MKKHTIPNLEQIQKATAYHRESIQLGGPGESKLDIPFGAKTALLIFQATGETPSPILYREGDTESLEAEPWIPATDGTIKELIGYEMRTFRAKGAGKDSQFIHVTYTK